MYFRVVQQSRDALAFQVVLDGERVCLNSVEFRDQAAVQRGIEAVIASLREGVDAALQVEGDSYHFTLRGEDGGLLARGLACPTPAEADAALAELQQWAGTVERFRIVNLARPQQKGARAVETIQVAVRYDLEACTRVKRAGLELLNRASDGLYSAHVHGERGEVLLYLRGFTTRFARDEQVESVLNAAADARRFDRREAEGRRYFVLTARNGREIARGPWLASEAECDAAIAQLVRLAPIEAREYVAARTRRKVAESGYDLTRRSTSGAAGFEVFRADDGHHYFHFNDEHGEALLFSHGYSTPKARDHGIRSLLKGATDPICYRVAGDELRFAISAVNGRELARSRLFRSRAALDRAIEWMRGEIIQFGRKYGIRLWESSFIELPHEQDAGGPAAAGQGPDELTRQALDASGDAALTRLAPPAADPARPRPPAHPSQFRLAATTPDSAAPSAQSSAPLLDPSDPAFAFASTHPREPTLTPAPPRPLAQPAPSPNPRPLAQPVKSPTSRPLARPVKPPHPAVAADSLEPATPSPHSPAAADSLDLPPATPSPHSPAADSLAPTPSTPSSRFFAAGTPLAPTPATPPPHPSAAVPLAPSAASSPSFAADSLDPASSPSSLHFSAADLLDPTSAPPSPHSFAADSLAPTSASPSPHSSAADSLDPTPTTPSPHSSAADSLVPPSAPSPHSFAADSLDPTSAPPSPHSFADSLTPTSATPSPHSSAAASDTSAAPRAFDLAAGPLVESSAPAPVADDASTFSFPDLQLIDPSPRRSDRSEPPPQQRADADAHPPSGPFSARELDDALAPLDALAFDDSPASAGSSDSEDSLTIELDSTDFSTFSPASPHHPPRAPAGAELTGPLASDLSWSLTSADSDLSRPPTSAASEFSPSQASADSDLSRPPTSAASELSRPAPPADSHLSRPPTSADSHLSQPQASADSHLSRPPTSADSHLSQPPTSAASEPSQPAPSSDSHLSRPPTSADSELSQPQAAADSHLTQFDASAPTQHAHDVSEPSGALASARAPGHSPQPAFVHGSGYPRLRASSDDSGSSSEHSRPSSLGPEPEDSLTIELEFPDASTFAAAAAAAAEARAVSIVSASESPAASLAREHEYSLTLALDNFEGPAASLPDGRIVATAFEPAEPAAVVDEPASFARAAEAPSHGPREDSLTLALDALETPPVAPDRPAPVANLTGPAATPLAPQLLATEPDSFAGADATSSAPDDSLTLALDTLETPPVAPDHPASVADISGSTAAPLAPDSFLSRADATSSALEDSLTLALDTLDVVDSPSQNLAASKSPALDVLDSPSQNLAASESPAPILDSPSASESPAPILATSGSPTPILEAPPLDLTTSDSPALDIPTSDLTTSDSPAPILEAPSLDLAAALPLGASSTSTTESPGSTLDASTTPPGSSPDVASEPPATPLFEPRDSEALDTAPVHSPDERAPAAAELEPPAPGLSATSTSAIPDLPLDSPDAPSAENVDELTPAAPAPAEATSQFVTSDDSHALVADATPEAARDDSPVATALDSEHRAPLPAADDSPAHLAESPHPASAQSPALDQSPASSAEDDPAAAPVEPHLTDSSATPAFLAAALTDDDAPELESTGTSPPPDIPRLAPPAFLAAALTDDDDPELAPTDATPSAPSEQSPHDADALDSPHDALPFPVVPPNYDYQDASAARRSDDSLTSLTTLAAHDAFHGARPPVRPDDSLSAIARLDSSHSLASRPDDSLSATARLDASHSPASQPDDSLPAVDRLDPTDFPGDSLSTVARPGPGLDPGDSLAAIARLESQDSADSLSALTRLQSLNSAFSPDDSLSARLESADPGDSLSAIARLESSDPGDSLSAIARLESSDPGNSLSAIARLESPDSGDSLSAIARLESSDSPLPESAESLAHAARDGAAAPRPRLPADSLPGFVVLDPGAARRPRDPSPAESLTSLAVLEPDEAPAPPPPVPSRRDSQPLPASHESAAPAPRREGSAPPIPVAESVLAAPQREQSHRSDAAHRSSDPPMLSQPPILPALEDATPLYRLSAPLLPPPSSGPLVSSIPLADPQTTATAPHGDDTAADDGSTGESRPVEPSSPREPDRRPPSRPKFVPPPLITPVASPRSTRPLTTPPPSSLPLPPVIVKPVAWVPPNRPLPTGGAPIPPITNPYPRPFISPGTLAAAGLIQRPGSANAASPSPAPVAPATHTAAPATNTASLTPPAELARPPDTATALAITQPAIVTPGPILPLVPAHGEATALPDLGLLAGPEHAAEVRSDEAPALVPELDVLLRDTVASPRRREGSAPLRAARREPSSTHAVPTLLARREPSSAQSAPALVPALDALEFDTPNNPRARRALPNLIPEPGAPVTLALERLTAEPPRGGRALPNLIPEPGAAVPRVLADPPRRDVVAAEAPVPKDISQPPKSPPPAVHEQATLLPIGLAVTQPAAVNPAPPPVLQTSAAAVPLAQLPPIRAVPNTRERWLWVGVVLAALAFIGAVASRLGRNSEPAADIAEIADEPPPEPPPVEPPPPVIPEPEPPPTTPPLTTANLITCPDESSDDPGVGLLVNPFTPIAGAPLRILAATLDDDVPLSLHLVPGDDLPASALATQAHLGLPSSATATWTPEAAGEYTLAVARDGLAVACRKVQVVDAAPERPAFAPKGRVWPVERAWTPAEEALYSAWLRELFTAGGATGFARLDAATGDPARNLLHDALGLREDDLGEPVALRLKPDGADLPYVVRAYWSWKRRLPFAYRKCKRGGEGEAPRCGDARTNLDPGPGFTIKATELARVQRFLFRNIGWGVHAGNARTALDDSASDLYPVRLDLRGLRPGAVYVDPHGQISLVVDVLPAQGDARGTLLTAGGSADGSIDTRRFWEGTFSWSPDPAHGGTGFKRFRPLVRQAGGLVQLSNAAILESADLGDIWTGHAELAGAAFYDAVIALADAPPWDASQVLRESVAALAELARARVEPVARAAEAARGRKRPITMPRGWEVFEATGAWESDSTPGRDLRLLIALDVVRRLPDRVRERPNLYVGAGDPEARAAALADELQVLLRDPQHAITYTRSDGSPWTITLHDLLAREAALELAYNPNDCPELRWGAPEGSDELATCSFRAPDDQRARMEAYRGWLHERRPPGRGDTSP